MLKYSVVIPTMWESDKIFTMLDIYQESQYVDEVIIIDNAPEKKIKINYSKCNVCTRGENIYVNPAWNWGVALSRNNNVIIANDDIIVRELDSLILLCNDREYELIGANFSIPFDDKNVIKPLIGSKGYGFGCLMFIKKEHYITIPYDLKIWRGDHILVKNLNVGLFGGRYIETEMSVTVNKFKMKASQDTKTYKRWKNRPKDITFVVSTHNGLSNIKAFMRSFIKNDNDFAIIIDNASCDGTREYLTSLNKENVMIVLNEEVLSDERCLTIGRKLSFPSKNFVFCDSTFVFNENWNG